MPPKIKVKATELAPQGAMPLEPMKKKRVRVEKSEESRLAMLKRLEEGRKKAFEVRLVNKMKREQEGKEHAEKVEKIDKLLKNEDIFEKKYKSQFDKIVDKLEYVEAQIKEEKEYKLKKRFEKSTKPQAQQVQAQQVEDKGLVPLETPNTSASAAGEIVKEQCPLQEQVKCSLSISQMLNSLPNYKTMKFGRNIK